jgi:hypothetical protein
MPIVDGQPAHTADIWFRVLTDASYIRRGEIHPNAFKGRQIAPPDPAKHRPWEHELSGRLRSLSQNVIAEAIAYCHEQTRRMNQNRPFSGVMFCHVARVSFEAPVIVGVAYTPLLSDSAHADLTFCGTVHANEETWDCVRQKLAKVMTGLHPAQMHLLPDPQIGRDEYSA